MPEATPLARAYTTATYLHDATGKVPSSSVWRTIEQPSAEAAQADADKYLDSLGRAAFTFTVGDWRTADAADGATLTRTVTFQRGPSEIASDFNPPKSGTLTQQVIRHLNPLGALAEVARLHSKAFDSAADETWDRNPVCAAGCGSYPCETATTVESFLSDMRSPSQSA